MKRCCVHFHLLLAPQSWTRHDRIRLKAMFSVVCLYLEHFLGLLPLIGVNDAGLAVSFCVANQRGNLAHFLLLKDVGLWPAPGHNGLWDKGPAWGGGVKQYTLKFGCFGCETSPPRGRGWSSRLCWSCSRSTPPPWHGCCASLWSDTACAPCRRSETSWMPTQHRPPVGQLRTASKTSRLLKNVVIFSEQIVAIDEIQPPHLVANPSGEECHELWGFIALNVPVLDGFTAQEVVQLDGQHGTGHLLVPGWLLSCDKAKAVECLCERWTWQLVQWLTILSSSLCFPCWGLIHFLCCLLHIHTCVAQRIVGRILLVGRADIRWVTLLSWLQHSEGMPYIPSTILIRVSVDLRCLHSSLQMQTAFLQSVKCLLGLARPRVSLKRLLLGHSVQRRRGQNIKKEPVAQERDTNNGWGQKRLLCQYEEQKSKE